MALNDVLTLITQVKSIDAYGDEVITETTKDVFCEMRSIGMKEFYQSAETGFKPEIAFRLADYYDYNDELYCVYNSKRYKIIRTYRTGIQIDLTCSREVNNGNA